MSPPGLIRRQLSGPQTLELASLADLRLVPDQDLRRTVVHIAEPVPLGHDTDTDVVYYSHLREATRRRVSLRWTLSGDQCIPTELVRHLIPPTLWDAGNDDVARGWRDLYRFGLLHFRKGPGFVTVKDLRKGFHRVTYTLTGQHASTLLTMADGIVHPLVELDTDAVQELVAIGVAIAGHELGALLALPSDEWPVPCSAL